MGISSVHKGCLHDLHHYVAIPVILLCALYGLSRLASADRKPMTEEEFEAEAKRSSTLGGAVGAFQKVFDPSHHVEYVEEQKQRVEAESEESGDRPLQNPPPPVRR